MRKKTKQTIELMNERLRKLEAAQRDYKVAEPLLNRFIIELRDRIGALEEEVDKLKVVDAAPEEPPVGSIIRDCDGYAWQHTPSGWWSISDPFIYGEKPCDWAKIQMYYGPTTVLYYNVDKAPDWVDPKEI